MADIIRTEISEEWAHSGVVEAGNYVFVSYCMANEGQSIENQINGAFDLLNERLGTVGLSLESVVKMDCLRITSYNVCYTKLLRLRGESCARRACDPRCALFQS